MSSIKTMFDCCDIDCDKCILKNNSLRKSMEDILYKLGIINE